MSVSARCQQRRLQLAAERSIQLSDRVHHPQAEIGRHLVVAAAPGMQLAAHRADQFGQAAFDRGVDIFIAGSEEKISRFQFCAGYAVRPCR